MEGGTGGAWGNFSVTFRSQAWKKGKVSTSVDWIKGVSKIRDYASSLSDGHVITHA